MNSISSTASTQSIASPIIDLNLIDDDHDYTTFIDACRAGKKKPIDYVSVIDVDWLQDGLQIAVQLNKENPELICWLVGYIPNLKTVPTDTLRSCLRILANARDLSGCYSFLASLIDECIEIYDLLPEDKNNRSIVFDWYVTEVTNPSPEMLAECACLEYVCPLYLGKYLPQDADFVISKDYIGKELEFFLKNLESILQFSEFDLTPVFEAIKSHELVESYLGEASFLDLPKFCKQLITHATPAKEATLPSSPASP